MQTTKIKIVTSQSTSTGISKVVLHKHAQRQCSKTHFLQKQVFPGEKTEFVN